jgi:hypothetical protein
VRTEWKLLAQIRANEPNVPISECAKRLGYSYQSVLMWLKKPEYQRYENWFLGKQYADLPVSVRMEREAVQEVFQDFAGEMQERLLAIIETTPDQRLASTLAQDWLDRAGHSPVRRMEHRGMTFTITADLHEMLERRAAEAALPTTLEGEVREQR